METEQQKEQESENIPHKTFFLNKGVKQRSKNPLLKERLRTLIRKKGLSEREFYHSLNMTRQYWYGVSWGILLIPFELKLKIAEKLGCDTSLIWSDEKNGRN